MVFFSGGCALMYEITWGRMFSVLFGNTTYALSAVVAVFMGGLALGGVVLGRKADQIHRPLLMYAAVETGIGITAFLVPLLLKAADPLLAMLYTSGNIAPWKLLAVRLAVSVPVLIVPTMLIGATFPVVSKLAVRSAEEVGRRIGLFYALNTFGAMIGCALTGFYLLPSLGVIGSSYLAAVMNLAIGGAAFLLHTLETRTEQATFDPETNFSNEFPTSPKAARLILVALFVSGFASLSYELLWSRVLGAVFLTGMSIVAFTAVVTIFLGGIAAGSFLYSQTARRIRSPVHTLGLLHIVIACSVFVFFWLIAQERFAPPPLGFQNWSARYVKAMVLMAVPTLLLGYVFPMACDLVTDNRKVLGRTVGRAYAVNTAGCVLGPLVTGFFLIPRFGSEATLKGMVAAGLVVGVLLLFHDGFFFEHRRLRMAGALAFLTLSFLLIEGPRGILVRLMNSLNAPVVYFSEGPSGTYLAYQAKDGIKLLVGGMYGAGSTPKLATGNEMAAYLPLLLHPSPTDVAAICFGTGRTSGLFARNPRVRRVDIVEIMEETIKGGEVLFSSYNQDVLHSPKVNVFLDDAFNFIKHTPRRYDVISVDAFMPRHAGSARLYTRDFLEFARRQLKPKGLVTLWAGPGLIHRRAFLLALKTFRSVFPHATVWRSPDNAFLFFVGSMEPIHLDAKEIQKRLSARPSSGEYPYRITDASQFANLLVMDESAAETFADLNELPLFTVDRPNLEYLFLRGGAPGLNEKSPLLVR
ncbi:MAG: fused MFS/spermidine synthase [Pseudomonadota bacterium]